MKLVHDRAVMAVKRTRGESRRMRRDWVTSALSIHLSAFLGSTRPLAEQRTKNDQARAQRSCGGATARSLQCQEHGRDRQDTTDGGKEAHRNVWHTGLQVVLA